MHFSPGELQSNPLQLQIGTVLNLLDFDVDHKKQRRLLLANLREEIGKDFASHVFVNGLH